ncbi:MAG: Gfo/Idh/MocA family protein [Actinomycetota bacterium]
MSVGVLRYGVVGVGMMGCEHVRNLAAIDGCEVVAIADPHQPSRQNALQIAPLATEYLDYRQMLRKEKLDVLVIASPNFHHRQVLADALEFDVHLFVEKPLCITADECRQIIEIDRRAGKKDRVVWVGLEYRFMAPTARLIAEVANGSCGKLRMISIREHRFPFLKKVDDWNRFNRFTGGTLVEKCCHFFDLMTLLARAQPSKIYASGAQSVNHLHEIYDGAHPDILDNAFVTIEFTNGVRAMLDLSMFAEGGKNEQEICVVGDEGKIEALMPESVVRIGRRDAGRAGVKEIKVEQEHSVVAGLHAGASFVEHVEMQRAIRKKSSSLVTLQDGLISVAVGQAAQLSIAEGRVVDFGEVLN